MKLRILGDSLRLRLSKSDVATFAETGRVEETIRFGASSRMVYALEHGEDVAALEAVFADEKMTVRMPTSMARAWSETDEVTLSGEQPLQGEDSLALLVEKDFKCAIPRAGEEDYDGFEHPTGGC